MQRNPPNEVKADALADRLLSLCQAKDAQGDAVYSQDEIADFLIGAWHVCGMTQLTELPAALQQRARNLLVSGEKISVPPKLLSGLAQLVKEFFPVEFMPDLNLWFATPRRIPAAMEDAKTDGSWLALQTP